MPDALHAYIAALPDPTGVVVVETHISWVLLAGEFAYKIKKPVTLPFLDYGTPEKRRACCLAAPRPASLVITFGPSGSGKTWATDRRLAGADFLDTLHIRSDVKRKRLFDLAPDADSGGRIYDATATQRTYARLAALAEQALAADWSVYVDAAFLKRAERDAFRTLATRAGVSFAILAPQGEPALMAARLAYRQGDASEAMPAVLARQLAALEPLGADERSGTQ